MGRNAPLLPLLSPLSDIIPLSPLSDIIPLSPLSDIIII
jgi:hypothetical protein